jgi:hypothetical protein
MFDPAGLATALAAGCEIYVGDAPGVPNGTYLSYDDLTCASCGGPTDAPSRSAAKWLAYNVRYNDGLCPTCDPPNGD